jgi:hypothetical protein
VLSTSKHTALALRKVSTTSGNSKQAVSLETSQHHEMTQMRIDQLLHSMAVLERNFGRPLALQLLMNEPDRAS